MINTFLQAISNSCMNGVRLCVHACIYALGVQRVNAYVQNPAILHHTFKAIPYSLYLWKPSESRIRKLTVPQYIYITMQRSCGKRTRWIGMDWVNLVAKEEVYREVAVSSREERRPCFLVSRVLLQVVNNLLQIGNIL